MFMHSLIMEENNMGGMPSQPAPPPEKSQYTYEGDELVTSKEVQGDKVITKQIPKREEVENKKRREEDLKAAEAMMKEFLPTLNTVDPGLQQSMEEEAQLMTSSAQENLDKSYQSAIQALRGVAAGRFGSTENAFYDRQMNDLNQQLAQQKGQLAKDIEGRKSDLKQQELANRQAYYGGMQSWANNLRQGVNDFRDLQAQRYNQNLQSSSLSNNFDAQNYSTQGQMYQAEVQAAAQKQAGIFGMFSDARLKENIRPTESVLDKLDNLGVYDYNYTFEPSQHKGLIAQEVEQVFPEAVGEHYTGYKMINQAELIPVLFQAIKELKDRLGG